MFVKLLICSVDSARNMASEVTSDLLLAMARSIVPQMTHQLYKGQCGRVAVIGGCKEYVLFAEFYEFVVTVILFLKT